MKSLAQSIYETLRGTQTMKLIDACKELILSKKGKIYFSEGSIQVNVVVQDLTHGAIKIGKEDPEEFGFEGNEELADYIINKVSEKKIKLTNDSLVTLDMRRKFTLK